MERNLLRVLLVDPDEASAARLKASIEVHSPTPIRITRVSDPSDADGPAPGEFDVALLALAAGEDPAAASAQLATLLPDVPVVTIGESLDVSDPVDCIERGIQGYVPRRCTGCPGIPRALSALRWAVARSRTEDEDRRARSECLHLALHDALTGLPNRNLLHDRLGQSLARGTRTRRPFALLFVDLDRFKQVNDSLGHAVGDRVLVETARRLEQGVRANDTVARWGGDEFLIVLEEVRRRADAARVARKLLEHLGRPFEVEGTLVSCRASVGVARFPADGTEAQVLIQNADRAMYRAKARGGNAYCLHEEGTPDERTAGRRAARRRPRGSRGASHEEAASC